MTKKVIQVPVDDKLLKDLDNLSKKQHKARAELIRQACMRYLRQIEYEELDKLYQQGYMSIPEEPEEGEVQIAMSSETLCKESW